MKNTKAALLWITGLLKKHEIPYQIAGGLAAQAYGAERELADIDIDIPMSGFKKIIEEVQPYLVSEPTETLDAYWESYLMTLKYEGQDIDISSIDNVKIFNATTRVWENLVTDLSKAKPTEILGVEVKIIPKEDLLRYKKILRRHVDLLDVQQIE